MNQVDYFYDIPIYAVPYIRSFEEAIKNNNKIGSYSGFVLKENDFPKELKVNESTAFLIFLSYFIVTT